MPLLIWQTPTGAPRVLAPYPVTVADLHAAPARGTAAELPPRRDAACPACGQIAAAPDPLPDGWRCAGPHGLAR